MPQEYSTTRVLPTKPQGITKSPKKKQAVGYNRVSDNPQAEEDRASLPEQERAIEEHCNRKGYVFLRTFSDIGKRWNAKRPGFQQMIAFAKENLHPGDVIVVWRADRIVGSASTAAALEPLLDQGGIDIEGVVEQVDKKWLLLYAMIAKGETEAKRERGRLGVRTAVKRRHYLGTPPYGRRWNKESKLVELDPEEAPWYKRMLVDWADWGDGKVAKYLNGMGVPTRLEGKVIKRGPRQGQIIGKWWTRSYVRKLRTSPDAYGVGSFRLKEGDELEFPLPAIVDKREFDEARRARAKRKNFGHRDRNRVYPVPHAKFRCGGCSLGFRIISRSLHVKRKMASGETRTYRRKALGPRLICRGMDTYPHLHQCRDPRHLDYEKLQGKVLDNLLEILTPEFCAKMVSEPKDTSKLEQKLIEVRNSRDAAKGELTWLVTQGRKGKIPDDEFDRQLTVVKAQLEFWEQQLTEAETELNRATADNQRGDQIAYAATVLRENVRIHSKILNYLRLMCPNGSPVLDAWRQALDEAAGVVREIVEDIIDCVVVMPDGKLVINYNFPMIEDVRSRQLTNHSLSLYR